jgi:Replication protein
MVPASYFGTGYMKQSEWVELWRESMRLDYNPVIDVQAVKKGADPASLVPELLKYCTKESDMVVDRAWFLELTEQLHKMRAIATGGVLKQYLRELEEEPEDLIGKDDEQAVEDFGRLFFGWRSQQKKYKLVN